MRILILVVFVWFAQNCFAQKDTLVWSDEFNGTGQADSRDWTYDLGNSGYGNNEIQNYTRDTRNVRQENGMLVIEAVKSDTGWTSARMITKGLHRFTYGRIVFRAKLPTGIGVWPALWMLGENIPKVNWPACGEIDIAEHRGIEPGMIYSSIHAPANYGDHVSTAKRKVKKLDSGFHLYQANWMRDRIEFSIDNIVLFTYKPEKLTSATWPFDKPFFIIMNIAMGGSWASDPKLETNGLKNGIDPSLSKVRMEVDYVRVFEPLQ